MPAQESRAVAISTAPAGGRVLRRSTGRALRLWIGAHPRRALIALCVLLYLPGLGNHDLWNPDEPRYAEVTREMIATGDYLVPHLNGRIYTHKPPLMFWAMALAGLLTGGLTELAVRLPSAAAAAGTVLLTHALGRRLFDDRAAWIAALVLATSTKVLWQTRVGQIDMLLTLLVTLTAYLWVRADLESRPALYLIGFGIAGLGTLAKGPVALLPLLLSWIAFLLLDRRREDLRQMRIGRGLLIWAAVVLAWLLPAALSAGSDFFRELVVTQNLTRYTAGAAYAGTRGHLHPWYYYLPVLALEFLPWTLYLPAAAKAIRDRGDGRALRAARLLLCWSAVTILFFSLSPAKRSVYILQMYPALALLAGGGISLLVDGGRLGRRWLGLPLAGLSLLAACGAGAVAILGPDRPEAALLPTWFPFALAAILGAIAVTAAAAAGSAVRDRPLRATAWTTTGFAIAALAVVSLLPALDPLKSVRPVAEAFRDQAAPDESYGFFPAQEPALQYYTGRLGELLETEEQVGELLERHERAWLFVERDDLERIAPWLPHLEEVARGADPENGYVLFRSSMVAGAQRSARSTTNPPVR